MKSANKVFLLGAISAGALVLGSATDALADAEQFTVYGCDGSPRAMRMVPEGSLSTVEIRVNDRASSPVARAVFQLASKSAQENAVTGAVIGGRGTFQDVQVGEWTLCPADTDEQGNFEVTQVAIINTDEESSSTKTAWLSAGGIAASGIGFGLLSGSSDSGSAVPSTTGSEGTIPVATGGEPIPQPLLPADSENRPSGTVADDGAAKSPDKPACAAEEDCLKGEIPETPLSPIS